jgi:DNA-directed RNA polymerase specialized sigma24 family protein
MESRDNDQEAPRMNKNEAILAGLAITVSLVVVFEVGPFGLLLLPLVFAEIGAMIWGKPRATDEEPGMRKLPQSGRPFDLDDIDSIVTAAQADDPRDELAWRALVAAVHPQLRAFCMKLCKTAPSVVPPDDLERIIWLKLVNKSLSTYSKGNFLGWLWVVTEGTFNDELRSWHSKRKLDVASAYPDEVVSVVDDAIDLFDWMYGLPADESFAFYHRHVLKQGWDEIVREMNDNFAGTWNRTACRRAADRVIVRLRRLEEEG